MTREEIINHVLKSSISMGELPGSFSPDPASLYQYSLPGQGVEYQANPINRISVVQAHAFRGKTPAGGFLPLLLSGYPQEITEPERDMEYQQIQQPVQIKQPVQIQQTASQTVQPKQQIQQPVRIQSQNIMPVESTSTNLNSRQLDAALQPINQMSAQSVSRNISSADLDAQLMQPMKQMQQAEKLDVSQVYPEAQQWKEMISVTQNYPQALPGREMISVNQKYPTANTFLESERIDAVSSADRTFVDAAPKTQKLNQTGTVQLNSNMVQGVNQQNPQWFTNQKSEQTSGLKRFVDYASNYQSNKMENAVQNPGKYFLTETAPYALAAPILSAGGALFGASAAAPALQQAGEKIQQAAQQTYSAAPTLSGWGSSAGGSAPNVSQAVQQAAQQIRNIPSVSLGDFVRDYNRIQQTVKPAQQLLLRR